MLVPGETSADRSGPVAWWKFNEGKGRVAKDSATQKEEAILRNFWFRPSVSGTAVKFDGFTTHIVRKAARAPRLTAAFTIEAWVAPQAYPYNWCAVVNQERDHKAGYFFGIDDFGRVFRPSNRSQPQKDQDESQGTGSAGSELRNILFL